MNLIDFYRDIFIKFDTTIELTPTSTDIYTDIYLDNSLICKHKSYSWWEITTDNFLKIEEMIPSSFESSYEFQGYDEGIKDELESLSIETGCIGSDFVNGYEKSDTLKMFVEVNKLNIEENYDNYYDLIDQDNYDIKLSIPQMNIENLTRHKLNSTTSNNLLNIHNSQINIMSYPIEKIVEILLLKHYEKYSVEII